MFGPGDVGFFDRIAPVYDATVPAADPESLRAALARAERPVNVVLDVAGGTGRAAAAVDADRRVVVDASLPMLRRARADGFECVRGDAGRLPVRDGSADAVVIADALHHLPDQRAFVDEAVRALAPGGVLVVCEFDPDALRGRVLVAWERLVRMDSTFTPPADLARFLDRRGLDAAVVEGGFDYTVAGVKRGSQ